MSGFLPPAALSDLEILPVFLHSSAWQAEKSAPSVAVHFSGIPWRLVIPNKQVVELAYGINCNAHAKRMKIEAEKVVRWC